ncbi:similar to Saccharomyces cerevisiae YML054C CYB2 Cytochrome b2 (L-lactate cytochrome-c oxidoreductase), component of the mitochondrial intermembrane space, required for lactate utilization [Maudiozyma barnettii]|uniref:L-lactate dehydrogenase (cytochrome) n=1 Tax=Maudiozyma barnettii TaxID=61262 RepID=A0A8H2VKG6_9SACH|nr:L-lactate dehydrogenase (cytochrome) [Kazachstania barnettii]CAB4257005.1 similar to Saccharomyces cerevisiae YML054C CYB2 Cytochrome b2 (L-lactate cytochrome-c oxidoreductase), component of the mitochondrial intermembrane space, required for lactate utilization [Kazachstania barnettii]CAD1779376.1 similar to Saccharomyces cerevisiae YML054C CYB2 Cytochrome b2 (L-lactate cytochrome-c oxidoreductase), component of the mitochondrial intermembrane space, required for lactate utilization [Kazachst
MQTLGRRSIAIRACRQFKFTKASKRALTTTTFSKSRNFNNSKNLRNSLLLVASASFLSYYAWNQFNHPSSDLISNDNGQPSKKKPISPDEVAKHNKPDDCWVVINGYVYDVTFFIPNHPGGEDVIKANAGKDVTAMFMPLHAKGTLEKNIPEDKQLGPLSKPMPKKLVCPPYAPGESPYEIMTKQKLRDNMPPLGNILNLYDFERLASKILTNQAWAYYSSGADDEITYRENHNAYHRIFFKPHILVDVEHVNLKTTMLGETTEVPFYVSATALCKLGNPEGGEVDIAKGCGTTKYSVPQMISTLASCSLDEVAEAKVNDKQLQWFQLYVNSDRKITRDLIKHAEDLGLKAIFVTVDAPSLGNREKDQKIKFTTQSTGGPKILQKKEEQKKENNSDGASKALSKFIDPSLSWEDIAKMRKLTKLPIVIKGVQRAEDAVRAAQMGCQGVVLSNHGGRQLDFSRAPIEVLAETMPILKHHGLDKNFDVFVDGGIRRGTDILKALCLGATGVGLGRPFLYANSCYGQQGVAHAIDIITKELEMSMRLLGVSKIEDLNPGFLDLTSLHSRSVAVARDSLYENAYREPQLAKFLIDDDD